MKLPFREQSALRCPPWVAGPALSSGPAWRARGDSCLARVLQLFPAESQVYIRIYTGHLAAECSRRGMPRYDVIKAALHNPPRPMSEAMRKEYEACGLSVPDAQG